MGCGASTEVPFMPTVAGELVDRAGQKVDATTLLQGKVKLVLFSAFVAGGPLEFVQFRLAPLYESLKAKGVAFEAVLVSDDMSPENFAQLLQLVPFWAVPFEDASRRNGLRYVLGAEGPCLFVLGEDDAVITTEGMQCVQDDPTGDKFPWKPSKVAGVMDMAGGLAAI